MPMDRGMQEVGGSVEAKHSSGSPWELQQGSPLQFDVTDQEIGRAHV